MSFTSDDCLSNGKRGEIELLSTFRSSKPISMSRWSAEKKSKVFDQLLAEFYLDVQQWRPKIRDRKVHKRRMDALNIFAYWQLKRPYIEKYFVDTYVRKRKKNEPGEYALKIDEWVSIKHRMGFVRCLPVVIPAWIRGYWNWADVVDALKRSRKDFFGLFHKGSTVSIDSRVKVPFRKKLKRFLLKQIDKL